MELNASSEREACRLLRCKTKIPGVAREACD